MTSMLTLPHALERTIRIRAPRETVFRFFTDPARWAAWWGPGSTIDASPGGAVLIRYPNGVEAAGEVVSVEAPERIVFTYGFSSGQPIPPGSSRVTIRLQEDSGHTVLRLAHEFAEAAVRDQHVQGWRYQLSVFANVVADEVQSGATGQVDAWFEVWREPDAATRASVLRRIAIPGLTFTDRYSRIEGLDELLPHIDATRRFMPGVRIERNGGVHRCQETAIADWVATAGDGSALGRGTNVFTFDADGRIASVAGVWRIER